MLVFVALCISPRRTEIDVSVTFIGFTNVATPSLTGVSFCVSNCGKVPVVEWPICSPFEYKNQDPDIFSRHFGDMPMWNVGPLILKPGQASRFSISFRPPSNTPPWRVWFGFAKAGWRMKLAGVSPGAQNILTRFMPKKWLTIRPEIEIPSDWINDPGPESNADKWWVYPQPIRR